MQWLRTSKYIILLFFEISKSMEPNKYTYSNKIMKIFIEVFSIIFQSSMGLGKSRCDFPSGTTQRCFHPKKHIFFIVLWWLVLLQKNVVMLMIKNLKPHNEVRGVGPPICNLNLMPTFLTFVPF
jgi:hypothetical protein